MECVDKELDDVRGNKCRKFWAKNNILYTPREESKKDKHCFLFIPGDVIDYGEIIYLNM